jgi:hypothetical protein
VCRCLLKKESLTKLRRYERLTRVPLDPAPNGFTWPWLPLSPANGCGYHGKSRAWVQLRHRSLPRNKKQGYPDSRARCPRAHKYFREPLLQMLVGQAWHWITPDFPISLKAEGQCWRFRLIPPPLSARTSSGPTSLKFLSFLCRHFPFPNTSLPHQSYFVSPSIGSSTDDSLSQRT